MTKREEYFHVNSFHCFDCGYEMHGIHSYDIRTCCHECGGKAIPFNKRKPVKPRRRKVAR